MTPQIVNQKPIVERPESTDALFDTSPAAMTARKLATPAMQVDAFSATARGYMTAAAEPAEVAEVAAGRAYAAARMAASIALNNLEPAMRIIPVRDRFADFLFRLGIELNREYAAHMGVRH